MPDRSWSDELQEMVDRKEGLDLIAARSTIARTTYQRFYRRYRRLAGMSGTLREVAGELWRVYRLPVAKIPLRRPDAKSFEPARGFTTELAKWTAIAARVERDRSGGAPVLIGARTVAASERASAALTARKVPHVLLNAAQDEAEAEIVARAGLAGMVTVATNMAGRGTDIRLAANQRPDVA
jgi:preprotein translocase subunit SecA